MDPAKEQGLTLEVLGRPPSTLTLRLPLQVGGYPHRE